MDGGFPTLLVRVAWTSNPEEYEIQCGRPGEKLWSAAVDGMRLLAAAKRNRGKLAPRILLHQPVNRINCHSLERTAQLAIEMGCNGIDFGPYHDYDGMLADYAIPDEKLTSVMQKLRSLRPKLKGKLSHNIDEALFRCRYQRVWEAAPCYIGWIDARVRIDGTVVPCNGCRLVMGDLKNAPLHDIWNDAPFRSFRRRTSNCTSLRGLRDICSCEFCCHLSANASIHRLARWLKIPAPLRPWDYRRNAHAP